MFTGIIESTAQVIDWRAQEKQATLVCQSSLVDEFYIGQSIAHNGVCLSIEKINLEKKYYEMTLVSQTLNQSCFGIMNTHFRHGPMYPINIERAMSAQGRFDGHFVQGHVDAVGFIYEIIDHSSDPSSEEGKSHEIYIAISRKHLNLIVERGSIAIQGISLTIASIQEVLELPEHKDYCGFSVCIIPHTYTHTNAKKWSSHDFLFQQVNIEFDIMGKYINWNLDRRNK